MEKRYLKPPIVEAICEFHLPPGSQWDIAVPGLIYEKIKDRFPEREQRVMPVEVNITGGPEGLHQNIRIAERVSRGQTLPS